MTCYHGIVCFLSPPLCRVSNYLTPQRPQNGPAASLDPQEHSHERGLAMRVCFGEDELQPIANRLP